jgi:hypothetical protein
MVAGDQSSLAARQPGCGTVRRNALTVHDELGGDILKTDVNGAWYFYNRIDGKSVDFTMSQFASPNFYDDLASDRDEAPDDTTLEQY